MSIFKRKPKSDPVQELRDKLKDRGLTDDEIGPLFVLRTFHDERLVKGLIDPDKWDLVYSDDRSMFAVVPVAQGGAA